MAASRSAAVSFPFSTSFPRLFSIDARARSSIGCATSTSRTSNPDCANTWAIPLPIVPAPMTPMVLIMFLPGPLPKPRRHEGHEDARRREGLVFFVGPSSVRVFVVAFALSDAHGSVRAAACRDHCRNHEGTKDTKTHEEEKVWFSSWALRVFVSS